MQGSPLDVQQVLRAARALLAFPGKRPASSSTVQPLFTDDQNVHAVLTLCKIPDVLAKLPLVV